MFGSGLRLPTNQVTSTPRGFRGKCIHLTADAYVQPNTSASGLNLLALAAPEGGAIEIDAIKFSLLGADATGGSSTGLGGIIGMQFDLAWLPPNEGRPPVPVTKGFIPVWLLDQAYNLVAERQRVIVLGGLGVYSEHRWQLKHPFYIPKGMVLRPTIRHFGFLNTAALVRVSYEARQLDAAPTPRTLRVPYACAYLSKHFPISTTSATLDTETSSETDLINPFSTPLRVEMFTGRLPVIFTVSGVPGVDDLYGTNFYMSPDQVLVRMQASTGDPVVRDFSQFRMVFERARRGWVVPHDLAPGGFYIVRLQTSLLAINPPVEVQTLQAQVGMVGWRELDSKSVLKA